MRTRVEFAAQLLIVLLSSTLLSNLSPSFVSSAEAQQAPAADLSGEWSGTWKEELNHPEVHDEIGGTLTLIITQSGNSFTGSIKHNVTYFSGSKLGIYEAVYPVNGMVSGSRMEFETFPFGGGLYVVFDSKGEIAYWKGEKSGSFTTDSMQLKWTVVSGFYTTTYEASLTRVSTPPPPPADLSGEWSGTYQGVLEIGGKTYFEYGKVSMYLTQTGSSFTGIMTLSRSNGTLVTLIGVSVRKTADIRGTVTENTFGFSFTTFAVNIEGTVTEYNVGSTIAPPISGGFTSDSMHLSYKGPQLDTYWYQIFVASLSRGSWPDGEFSFRIVPESNVWILPPRLEQGPLYPYQVGYLNEIFSIYVEATNATPELVSLRALAPEGLDILFDPQTGYPPFRSTVLVDASHVEQNITAPYGLSLPPGTYTLMIIGESGGLVRGKEVALILQYFSVKPLPSEWPPPYPGWWVKRIQGDAKIERGGQNVPLQEGQQLSLGDSVRSDGIIVIIAPDGSETQFEKPVTRFVGIEESETESGITLDFTPPSSSSLLRRSPTSETGYSPGGALTVVGIILRRYGYSPLQLIRAYPAAAATAALILLAAGSLYAFHKYLESQSQKELQAYVEELWKQPEPPKPIPQQLLNYSSQISSRTVITPDGVIISSGTELTVDVDATGTRVRVLSGTVEVWSYDGQNTTVTTNQQLTLRYMENGTSIFESSSFNPNSIDKWWLQAPPPPPSLLTIAIVVVSVFSVLLAVVAIRRGRKHKSQASLKPPKKVRPG